MPRDHFEHIARNFTEKRIASIVRKKALDQIQVHVKNGVEIIVLTASPDLMLQDFCRKHNARLIATQIEVKQGVLTGRFASPNCRGEEKVTRLRSEIDLDVFDYIYTYGDTPSDQHFMSLGDSQHYKPFRD